MAKGYWITFYRSISDLAALAAYGKLAGRRPSSPMAVASLPAAMPSEPMNKGWLSARR